MGPSVRADDAGRVRYGSHRVKLKRVHGGMGCIMSYKGEKILTGVPQFPAIWFRCFAVQWTRKMWFLAATSCA